VIRKGALAIVQMIQVLLIYNINLLINLKLNILGSCIDNTNWQCLKNITLNCILCKGGKACSQCNTTSSYKYLTTNYTCASDCS